MHNSLYQALTDKTNIYPKEMMLECLVLGICSEAGEIADKVKKYHRGDKMDSGLKLLLKGECGDLLWYISELCTLLGYSLSEVMESNIKKLESRKQRGVINGSGDDR